MAFENLETTKKASVTFYDDDNRECGRMILYTSSAKSLLKLSEDECRSVDDDFEYEFEEIQLLEGQRYHFDLDLEDGYWFNFKQSSLLNEIKENFGTLQPGTHTGLLQFYIQKTDFPDERAYATLEVQSVKAGSLHDYRKMISDIAEKCNDLLLQMQAPSLGRFESDDTLDVETLTQRFYFLRSLLESAEFSNAITRILRNPHIRSEGEEVEKKLSRGGFRVGYREARQITRRNPRIPLPPNHPMYGKNGLKTLPENVITIEHRDNTDIPENRFIKFALCSFENILDDIKLKITEKSKNREPVLGEITLLQNKLSDILSHGLFKSLSHLTQLPLSSPVLQRKEGYRDILRIWLQMEISAKIVWKGGQKLFQGGLRDVATLYEYWLFFKLIDTVNSAFEMRGLPVDKDNREFITVTDDGLGLQLKAGRQLEYKGTYPKGSGDDAKLNVMFCYNRTFKGNNEHDYTKEGSWTKYMRPDYTISLWPISIKDTEEAEKREKMIHLHFDAKYRIVNPSYADSVADIVRLFQDHNIPVDNEVFGTEADDKKQEAELKEEAEAERAGIASKRADLLKMHAYRDAIKRTEGAYVLYPGSPDKKVGWQGYHELLPGIGAFPVCPGSAEDMSNIEQFLKDSADLCIDRFSQLYRQRHWTKNIMISDEYAPYGVSENPMQIEEYRKRFIPEKIKFPPEDTGVIVGFIREEALQFCRQSDGTVYFYFHAVNEDGETNEIDERIFSAKYLMPYTETELEGIVWLEWYAEIMKIELKPRNCLLNELEMSLHSKSQFYYLITGKLMPDVNETFTRVKNPEIFLPKEPHRPHYITLAELWNS